MTEATAVVGTRPAPGFDPPMPTGDFVDLSDVLRGEFDPEFFYSPEDVKMRQLDLPDYTVRDVHVKFRYESFTRGDIGDAGLLNSCIMLEGRSKIILPDAREVASHDGSQNFKFDPNTEFAHWCPPDTTTRAVILTMDVNKFSRFLPEDERWSDEVKMRIEKRQAVLGGQCTPVHAFQLEALHMILNCPITGRLGRLMIESAIMQVLVIQMDSFFRGNATDRLRITKRDADIMRQVKDHLDSTYLEEQSLVGLARSFGINQSKMMKLFRAAFDTTIFDYITQRRMDYAKKLLQKEGLTVSQVSSVVGYKNSQHFSIAFKRRFGVSPSLYK
ncbi:MAG TPA: AraC family transcriptional regulator [Cyclobacteriaceae bacterium]|nr:AraC family transcriptional regulator [Cyclobacteriaceae bacterium]